MNYLFILIVGCVRIYSRVVPLLSYRYRPGVCEFPSIYRDKVIKQCQLGTDGLWWCPRDENFDAYNHKSICPNTSITYAGSDPGKLCHFPFIYNGKEYNTCIKATEVDKQGAYWWCSTTSNYDNDQIKRWTRCKEQSDLLPCHFQEKGGLGLSAECRHFNNKWVCHTERSEIRECPRTRTTYAGNSPGERCHFPFLFGKAEYRSCISARRTGNPSYGEEGQFETYLWCATTANYDSDRRWTKCVIDDNAQYWKDRRILIPVSVILSVMTLFFCLATLLHFCCDRHQGISTNKQSHWVVSEHRDRRHISMRDIVNTAAPSAIIAVPSAPPSYLEAVMALNDHHPS